MRAHVDVIGLKPVSHTLRMTQNQSVWRTASLVKREDRYTHAPVRDMVAMLKKVESETRKSSQLVRKLLMRVIYAHELVSKTSITKNLSHSRVCSVQ